MSHGVKPIATVGQFSLLWALERQEIPVRTDREEETVLV